MFKTILGSNTKPFIKVSATFYNKTTMKFYGRTYNSEPIPLIQNEQSTLGLETSEPINIYYYSSIDRTNDNIIILEAHLLGIGLYCSIFYKDNE